MADLEKASYAPPHQKSSDYADILRVLTNDETDVRSSSNDPQPDSLYGWWVVICGFTVITMTIGFTFSFGVLIVPLASEFNQGRGTISWMGSACSSTQLIAGVVSSRLVTKYGFQKLIISGTCVSTVALLLSSIASSHYQMYASFTLLGLGQGLAYIPSFSCVAQWFLAKRGLAVAFALTGVGVGNIMFPPVMEATIDAFGWRRTLQGVAAIGGVLMAISAVFLRERVPLNITFAYSELLVDRRFQLLWLGNALIAFGFLIPFVHIVPYALDHGFGDEEAALVLSTLGLTSIFGRISLGMVGDKLGHMRVIMGATATMALTLLGWALFGGYNPLCLYIVGGMYGVSAGAWMSTLPVALAEVFGIEKQPSVTGPVYMAAAPGILISAPIAGWIFDTQGSYQIALWIAASFEASGALVLWLFPWLTAKAIRADYVELR